MRFAGIYFPAKTDNILANCKHNYKLRASSDGFVLFVQPGHEYEPFYRNCRALVCIVGVKTKPIKCDLFCIVAVIVDVC